jgi:hypothetical protein
MRIVRRTLLYLRQHDWAAVAIEVVVVVIGVFIGIQAANWNEARGEDRRAAVFSQRLRDDLREEAWGYEMQVGYYSQVAANARRAADGIAGRIPMSDEALLVAAYRATQYNSNIRRRATYDELTSTGEIGLIREPALRDLAMRVYTSPMFLEIDQEGRNSQYRLWFRQHIDHDLQGRLSVACGDREVVVGRYEDIAGSLDYPCEPALEPAQLSAAVASLRADPAALQLLRLRLADVETGLSNLRVFNRTLRNGLAALAATPH